MACVKQLVLTAWKHAALSLEGSHMRRRLTNVLFYTEMCANHKRKPVIKSYLLRLSSVTTPPLPDKCSKTLFIFSLNSEAITFYINNNNNI